MDYPAQGEIAVYSLVESEALIALLGAGGLVPSSSLNASPILALVALESLDVVSSTVASPQLAFIATGEIEVESVVSGDTAAHYIADGHIIGRAIVHATGIAVATVVETVTVTRSSAVRINGTTSYRMDVRVSNPIKMTSNILVKQRLSTTTPGQYNDVFVAVATPTQIEDLCVDAPCEGDSYFLTSAVTLINEDPEYLEQVFDIILAEIRQLVASIGYLNVTQVDAVYRVTANSVTPIT